jgi:hypothetical protein
MRTVVLTGVLALSLWRVDIASATRRVDISIDQLTRGASVIFEGEVTDVRGEWNADRTRITTTVSIRVDQYHKGNLGRDVVEIRLAGGSVDDITMAVIGQPSFERDERVFLFLKPNFERRDTPVAGDSAGKLRVATDANGADILLGPTQTFEKSDVVREIRSVLRPIGQ